METIEWPPGADHPAYISAANEDLSQYLWWKVTDVRSGHKQPTAINTNAGDWVDRSSRRYASVMWYKSGPEYISMRVASQVIGTVPLMCSKSMSVLPLSVLPMCTSNQTPGIGQVIDTVHSRDWMSPPKLDRAHRITPTREYRSGNGSTSSGRGS